MRKIIIEPLPVETINDHHIRRCIIKRYDSNAFTDQKELWFKFPKQISPPDDKDCDSYLVAFILDAMAENRDITVKGSVSKELLGNLVEYQAIWNKWLPNNYKIIDIVVETIRENETPVFGAVSAFTGGVDGTFSVWRHSQNKNSYRSQKINFCTFIHGFDIPLSDSEGFEGAKNKAAATLKSIGIELLPMQTNYRLISVLSWEHTFGIALVAAMNNFKNVAGSCILGSSGDYNNLHFPWGSTPVADYLLSSDHFKVIHDGSSHSRTEKIKELSQWNMGINNLRVCWEGEHGDKNCGNCEKCLRTQANLLAINQPIPNCFPNSGDVKTKISHLSSFRKTVIKNEWKDILYYAKENNIQDEWVEHIETIINSNTQSSSLSAQKIDFPTTWIQCIRQSTPLQVLFPLGSRRRRLASKFYRKVLLYNAK